MKLLVLLALIFLMPFFVDAGIGIQKFNENIPHKKHCYDSLHGFGDMEKGEVKQVAGKCAIVTCQNDRDVRENICSPIEAEPPCYVRDGDKSKPFPDCCYEIKCNK